jgi:macrolide phosphotransferase
MTTKNIQRLAETHGLQLTDQIQFNEMGIDFKVGFATDQYGQQWVLRIPRREGLDKQIENEKHILNLVRQHLSVQVPNWEIASPELIAYRLLKDKPALTFDAKTYKVTWNIDQQSPHYISSLAKILVELHGISEKEAAANDIKILNPEDLRTEIADRLALVKQELGINKKLENRYRKWLDNDSLWPGFTKFIHGDLYAGHILASPEGKVTGIIDWTTGQISDPAMDFSGHYSVFGEQSLKDLINAYQQQGGAVWDRLFEQALERTAAAPLAYGLFALETNDEKHITGAKGMLGSKKRIPIQ